MDRRKGQPCTTRASEWHRALFSACKRGKSDPQSPPKPRNRSHANAPARENATWPGTFVKSALRSIIVHLRRRVVHLSDHFFRMSSAAMRHVWEPQACVPLHPPWATMRSTCVACIHPGQPDGRGDRRFAGCHNGVHGADVRLPAIGLGAYHASFRKRGIWHSYLWHISSLYIVSMCKLQSSIFGH
jgi:hypothetical protein